MGKNDRIYDLDRIFRILLKALLLAGTIVLLHYLRHVLLPFAAALLLAYLLNPMVNALQRRLRRRGLAVFTTLLLTLAATVLLALLIIPMLASEFAAMQPLVRQFAALQPPAWLQRLAPNIHWQQITTEFFNTDFQELFVSHRFWNLIRELLQNVLPGVWNVITGTFSLLLGLLGLAVVFLYTIFLLIDYNRIREIWPTYLPTAWRQPAVTLAHDFNDAMSRYFRGQILIALIVGGMFAVGFRLIGLPLAISLGLFIGLLNIIPYLQVVGMIPALALALLYGTAIEGNPWRLPLLALLVLALVQGTQDLLLTPRIMGRATGLSPALILLSLAVWGKLLGMLGLLIAIPMTCLLLVYYRRTFLLNADRHTASPT
ncbi:MAG: AI-2E family transporter [Kiritimatiellia bacterium]|nr:AI-2E family transporter [Lentisphaerota bacterium]